MLGPEPATVALFLTASLALLLVPGPAVLYIVARSIEQGARAGLVSAVGVGMGSLVHVLAATVGLSAVLTSSALAFSVVKYLGAAYLVVLGVRALLARPDAAGADAPAVVASPRSSRRVFAQGIVVNVLNPKTALFFLAFLPQFVDPARGPAAAQTLLFGGMFVLLGICSDSLYALVAGRAGAWLRGNARFLRTQRYVSGVVFIGLGLTAALADADNL